MLERGTRLFMNLYFFPSAEELQDTTSENVYSAGLESFEASVRDLTTNPALLSEVGRGVMLREERVAGHNFLPAIIIMISAFAKSPAAALMLYSFLKLWVDARKGRKIVWRGPRGYSIEASQLSKKQFLELLAATREIDERQAEESDSLKRAAIEEHITSQLFDELRRQEITVMSPDEIAMEEIQLHNLLAKTRRTILERHRQKQP
jgi:hypothetical protein